MALTRVFRLSNSPPLYHCRRTFSTALNRDSKSVCSKPLIGSFVRLFSTSPVVSDDMQKSVSEDEALICSVKSLRQDVDSLRKEFSPLSEVVDAMRTAGGLVSDYDHSDDGNAHVLVRDSDSDASNKEKATEGISDFSDAMDTQFNTNTVISLDSQSEEIREGETGDVIEEIRETGSGGDDNQKVVAAAEGMMSDFSEGIQKSDKEQNSLLEEIESEISRAVEFNHVSSQSANFPDDFPFKLEKDVHGIPSITLKGRYKSENMVVTVDTPSVFTPITSHNFNHYKSSNFIMKLIVEIFPTISEGREIAYDCSLLSTGFRIENVYAGRRKIAFECSAFSTGFMIENVYGRYGGKLIFRELNDDLQTEFKKYLETRGIKPSTTNCILGYMLHKKNRDNLRSLYKFKEPVEA